jgi:hypothetical protein
VNHYSAAPQRGLEVIGSGRPRTSGKMNFGSVLRGEWMANTPVSTIYRMHTFLAFSALPESNGLIYIHVRQGN